MSDAAQRPTSRERLIDATVDLLRSKGPTASGTAEILARADSPRGSFYFHFPEGKEQLITLAVDRAAAATAATLIHALADRSIPINERVELFIRDIAADLAADDFQLGCAVGATVLETSSTSPSLRLATETAFALWTSVLVEHFIQEQVSRDDAIVLADAVVAGMEGATMMARARSSTAPLEHVAKALSEMVARAVRETRTRA